MTAADVAELVLFLVAAYPDKDIPEQTTRVYERALIDLDRKAAFEAAVHHVATHKWFPTVSEIRESVLDQELALPSGVEALEQARTYVPATGMEMHPLVRRALDATGGIWGRDHSQNGGVWRAQFRKAYEEAREGELAAARRESAQKLLAQFSNKQLEDDHGRPAQLTGHNRTRARVLRP